MIFVPSNLITVRAYSLEDKERYDIVLVKRSTLFTFYNKSVVCTRYVCMVITYSRVWINRVRLPILLVVSREQGEIVFSCPRTCLRVWSPETGSAVPSRYSLLISILRLNLVLTYDIPPEFRGGVH